MADESATIQVCVADWEPSLVAEHDAIVRERGGRPLSPEELARWMAAVDERGRAYAGEAVEAEAKAPADGLLDRVVRVPGTDVELRLRTLAAQVRLAALRDEAARLGLGAADIAAATAYCLAHGNDSRAMARLADPATWLDTVRQWSVRLTCSAEQLEAAIDRLVRGAYPPEGEGPPPNPPRPPTGPGSCAGSGNTSGAPLDTGSTACPRPISAG